MSSSTVERRVYEALPPSIGLMSAPLPAVAGPGLMSSSGRSGRGLMEPDPDLPPFEWRRDGVAFLWLLALIVAFVVSIGLFAQGTGQLHTTATASVAAHQLKE
jgi:hypothetical protein